MPASVQSALDHAAAGRRKDALELVADRVALATRETESGTDQYAALAKHELAYILVCAAERICDLYRQVVPAAWTGEGPHLVLALVPGEGPMNAVAAQIFTAYLNDDPQKLIETMRDCDRLGAVLDVFLLRIERQAELVALEALWNLEPYERPDTGPVV